jgi:undecaprenyl-diphosphatase
MTAAHDLKSDVPASAMVRLRRWFMHIVTSLITLVRPVRVQAKPAWKMSRRQFTVIGAIIVASTVLGMLLLDAPSISAVRHVPWRVSVVFDFITDFGKSGWFLWPLGILFLLLAAIPQGLLSRTSQLVLAAVMVRVGFIFMAIGVPSLFTTIVKRVIGRARPFVTGIADPFVYWPFNGTAAYASLPSGHGTTAFAVLVAVGSLWPRYRTILLIYALLIAVSRVVVIAHHPTDVLAGAVVGIVGAVLVRRYFALRRLGFSIAPDGTIHQLPGPSLRRIKSVARDLLS